MKIKVLIGLPGSGKSTFAKNFCKKNKNWIRINRDDLRNMRGDYWIPKQEDLITLWEDTLIDLTLSKDYNVVLDATNLNKDRAKARMDKFKAKYPDLSIEYKFFDVSLEECIKRDLARPNSVGKEVIEGMYNKYLKPVIVPYIKQKGLPNVIICDLDGTLALINGRDPYDASTCDQDLLNLPVASILDNATEEVILLSGRSDKYKSQTIKFLDKYDIKYKELHMRKDGDFRKDSIVKEEMFNNYIRDKYNVSFVLDDRNQVVNLWRSLGLTCFQVADGNF